MAALSTRTIALLLILAGANTTADAQTVAPASTRATAAAVSARLVHGRRSAGPVVVALYDLTTGDQRWVNETLFDQTEPKKKGLGGLVQGLVRRVSEGTALQALQAGPEMIVVHTLMGLKALDAQSGETRWAAALPTARAGNPAKHVRLYPSLDKADRIYVSFDDRLMAYRIADGQPLWAKPATVSGWIRDIVQHPAGIVILPEAAPEGELTGSRVVKNGVVQTGLNVARYEDGGTIASKPIKMRGDVIEGMIAGDAVVLAVDADSKTFVNVLDVATVTVRLKKDVKIKGQLDYAELTPAGLLYVSRPDATTNAEVNVIDLTTGEPRFKDAIESGKPRSSSGYDAERYYLNHAVEGRTFYVFANRDHQLYAIDRDAGTSTSGSSPGAARAERGPSRVIRRRRLGLWGCLRPSLPTRNRSRSAAYHRRIGQPRTPKAAPSFRATPANRRRRPPNDSRRRSLFRGRCSC